MIVRIFEVKMLPSFVLLVTLLSLTSTFYIPTASSGVDKLLSPGIDHKVPLIHLRNGHKMPIIGLGTFKATGDEIYNAVKSAIKAGYTHIDTAYLYQNEKEIGRAIKDLIAEKKVTREELFIVTKLWHTFHSKTKVLEAIKKSLENLGLTYLDQFLIHMPFGLAENTSDLVPKDKAGNVIFSDVDYLESWSGMEAAFKANLTKSIGVSNFNSKQLLRIMNHASIMPDLNQIECHPFLNQNPFIEFMHNRGIHVTAFSPLGSGNLLNNTKVVEIANKYNATAAQVLIRYQMDRAVVVIPKSTKEKRLIENISVFNFTLNHDDIKAINSINKNERYNKVEYAKHHKYYPFNIPW